MKTVQNSKLDQVLSDRRLQNEKDRQILLRKTQQWLEKFASDYGIQQAFLFGSVIHSGKFHSQSDVDLAVEQINPEDYCPAISLLSEFLERDVDIILLENCHFADRIRQTGILWEKTP